MKRSSTQIIVTILVILLVSMVFSGVRVAWAANNAQSLSLSQDEDVAILGNGNANVTLLINVPASPLANIYRQTLAAPPNASVGEEIPIPENTTDNGTIVPVEQMFFQSVIQEQENSLGFAAQILNSNMVPMGAQGEFNVSINAIASLQVVNFTAVGSDGIWQIAVGPQGENATEAAAESAVTSIAFAQQLLNSSGGYQVYEVSKVVRITVPQGATLLNGEELGGLSWTVNFGGGTLMSASVSIADPSTVVLNEMTVVTEGNITAAPEDVFAAFGSYGVFNIIYSLPGSAFMSGESGVTSSSDWSQTMNFVWSPPSIPAVFVDRASGATLTVDMQITPSFDLTGYLGFGFKWYGALDWFEAWIGVSESIDVKLDVIATGAISETWASTLFQAPLTTYNFIYDLFFPVWINLDLSLIPTITVSANFAASFSAEYDAGASLRGGLRYDDGWSAIKEADTWSSFKHASTLNGTATVTAGLKFTIGYMVFDSAGAYEEVEPYFTGSLSYDSSYKVTSWDATLGIMENVGVTFAGWLAHLLGLQSTSRTLVNGVIDSWSGHIGIAPSSISISVSPSSTYALFGVVVSGSITSPFQGDLSGTVYIESSTNNQNWNGPSITTQASSAGGYSSQYSAQLVIPSSGTYYIRARWDGNGGALGYTGAESAHIVLPVYVTSAICTQHEIDATYGTQGRYGYYYVPNAFIIYPENRSGYSSGIEAVVSFGGQPYNDQLIEYKWCTPDGQLWGDVQGYWGLGFGEDSCFVYVDETAQQMIIEADSTQRELATAPNELYYEPYLGRVFCVEIWFDNVFILNMTFLFTKHESNISVALSSGSLTYGQSLQVSSQLLSPSFSPNPTTLQYSTNQIIWYNIAAGTSSNGYYSSNWTPQAAGTYYVRAVWPGDQDVYWGSTSSTVTLTVNPLPTSLATTLSANTITWGSAVTIGVTIAASMTPALQGANVTFQYSLDGITWYPLSLGTTNSAGQNATSWTPPYALVYYIRSSWHGNGDYLGANSTTQKLTVQWAPLSTQVEIVSGANAIVDGTPNALVPFAVQVKDQNGQYLKDAGTVEFYVSDYSHHNMIFAGSDNDSNGDGVYQILWNASSWPTLGPQHWSAIFTGTPKYNESEASTNFMIYYYGAAIWINPTFQAVNITSSTTYTVNFGWDRDTTNTFTLALAGLIPSWYTLSQTSITVNSKGQTEQATLTVSPPKAPTILKDYDFTVTATNATRFSVSASATLRVSFTPTLPASHTGGLAIAVQPKTIPIIAGTTITIYILVVNNQNFDDTINIDITNGTSLPQYQANLAWLNWTATTVFLPAGSHIYIPLKITVPSTLPTGTKTFTAIATSTANLATTAKDSGILSDPPAQVARKPLASARLGVTHI